MRKLDIHITYGGRCAYVLLPLAGILGGKNTSVDADSYRLVNLLRKTRHGQRGAIQSGLLRTWSETSDKE